MHMHTCVAIIPYTYYRNIYEKLLEVRIIGTLISNYKNIAMYICTYVHI